MRKRYSSRIILVVCMLIIAGPTAYYFLSNNSSSPFASHTNQTQPLDEPPVPSTSPAVNTESSSPVETEQVLPAPKPVHISDPQAVLLYEQGLKLYYQRSYPEALDRFNQALQIDALCYEALNAKGATLAFQGHHDQGLALIKQALELNPSFVYAQFNQGLALELAGRWDESIAAYQKALQLDHRDTWSYYGIASIYGRQGNVDKVLDYLKPAIELEAEVKEVARNEHDFLPVRNDPRFQELVKP